MPFLGSLIGAASGEDVATIAINVKNAVAAGSKIIVFVAMNGLPQVADSAGNVYLEMASSTNSYCEPSACYQDTVALFEVDSANAVANNGRIIVKNPSASDSTAVAYVVPPGSTAGSFVQASSTTACYGDTSVSLPTVDPQSYVAVLIGSYYHQAAKKFTPDLRFSPFQALNQAGSKGEWAWGGYAKGSPVFNEGLGFGSCWAGMMVELTP